MRRCSSNVSSICVLIESCASGRPTWNRVFGPCSLAGLRGATGLRLLQKWMLDSRGLGVSNNPLGVCNTKNSSEFQLHAALTTPEALQSICWLYFPVNSDIQHGQQQLPTQPCILSLDTCTFNIPSYANWFCFYSFNEMHSYCLFEPCSCHCNTQNNTMCALVPANTTLFPSESGFTFWRAAIPWPACSFWSVTAVVCGAEKVTAGLWHLLPWRCLFAMEEGSRSWKCMGWAGRGSCTHCREHS